MYRRSCSRILVIFSASFAVNIVLAQNYDLSWYTIDGGGAMSSTGGAFSLSGTNGQPDAQASPVMSGGPFILTGGFWPVSLVCYCPGDMNGDGRRDGADIQKFVSCLITGGSCDCADIDTANGVNLADINGFVAKLLATAPCP